VISVVNYYNFIHVRNKKNFMSVELRSLWVFNQTSGSRDLNLVTSRRFQTVEIRFKRAQEQAGIAYHPIPFDQDVLNDLRENILHEHHGQMERVPCLSKAFSHICDQPVFDWNQEQEGMLEKSWPLGPVSSISDGSVWPFIFISTSGDYSNPPRSDRFIVAAVVSIPGPRRSLIETPQITAGFGILEEVSGFLPSSATLSSVPASSARFQFYLKSALPFGSPVIMSPEILEQLNTMSVTRADQAYAQNVPNQSSRRLPAWRPLQTQSTESSQAPSSQTLSRLASMKIAEKLVCQIPSFSNSGSQSSACTIIGTVEFDSDIPGTPELVVPVSHSTVSPVITLHESARISEVFQDPPKTIEKISFIPPTSRFAFAKYFYTVPTSDTSFPVRADFNLMQISQSRFRFRLALDHKILFQYLFVRFRIFQDMASPGRVQSLLSVECSARSKIDILETGEIEWSLRNPSTFTADGEFVEGVADIDACDTGTKSELSKSATCYFALAGQDSFGSNFSIDPKRVTVFPHVAKSLNVSVSYSVTSQSCLIANSAVSSGAGDHMISPDLLEDCIVCDPPELVLSA